MTEVATPAPTRRHLPRARVGAVVSLALAAGAVAWVVAGRSDPPPSAPTVSPERADTTSAAPQLVTASELGLFAAAQSAPVYWAGPRADASYELTRTAEGRVFVRYLGSAEQLGSSRPDFLAVATYSQQNAYAAIRAAAKRPGAVTIRPAGGGLAVYDRARPTSVYLAFPGGNRQIEVYHPSGAEALRLVSSGAVAAVPVPGAPRVVTSPELASFASSRDLGVYWAGARPATVLELTETSQGSVFVRYLREPSDLGSPQPDFLAVATYPRAHAFADLKVAARRPGAVPMRLPGGGLAVYDRARPTSVYLAFPGGNRQIEVYHPDARQARSLVQRGAIVALP